jgi:cytochrome c biogenesis protein CcdA
MQNIKLDDSLPPLFIESKEDTRRGRWSLIATFVLPAILVVGLLFLLVSYQGGLETGLANLTRLLPVGFAFAAGMVASVNPCGVLMLPSYALYQVGTAGKSTSTVQRVLRALLVALAATLGFVAVFAAVGAVIATGGRWLIGAFPWAGLLIGIGMASVGIWLLVTRKMLGLQAVKRVQVKRKRTIGNAVGFGVSYAIGSLSCTLPVFLAVVGSALSSDQPLSAFGQMMAYAAGMGSVLVTAIVGTALFQQAVSGWLSRLTRYVQRISALFLFGAGAYLVYYWVFVAGLGLS